MKPNKIALYHLDRDRGYKYLVWNKTDHYLGRVYKIVGDEKVAQLLAAAPFDLDAKLTEIIGYFESEVKRHLDRNS